MDAAGGFQIFVQTRSVGVFSFMLREINKCVNRFGVIEGEDRKSALYMLANPTGLPKKQKSYLQQWLPDEGVIKKSAEIDESLAALAVRNDGRFVAVGTMFSGSVLIYIAFSLQVRIIVVIV